MRSMNLRRWLLAPCALLSATGLSAQAVDDTTPADSDELIVLSPFEVTGTNDVGYQATSTLGGTRVNTSLRDVGASISVVNEELLRDTGASNLEDVLVLTPNTEVGGLGGNFSGAQTSGNPVPEIQRDNLKGGMTRVRGLASADLTRDYFITDIPFDAYNTNRVEVQRGANSALFGLGSPGGIVNNSTVKADFLGSRGSVTYTTDQYGTSRTSLDYNYQINDSLSVRVAGLTAATRYEQQQAFKDDDRAYVSVTGRLPYGFTVRGSYEHGEMHSAIPDSLPPNDGITPWINMGSPIITTPYEAGQFYRTTGDIYAGVRNNGLFTVASSGTSSGFIAFYQDPSNPDPTFGGTAFVRAGRGAPNYYQGVGGNGEWMLLMPRNEYQIIASTGLYSDGTPVATGTAGFFPGGNVSTQITDRSIFDYRKNLFSGGAAQQWTDFDVYNASLEGNWLDGRLGLELAYYKQEMMGYTRNPLQGSSQRTLYIDPMAYLIADDGSGGLVPNPTFGRPVMGGLWQGGMSTYNRENARATAFGELRFDDFMNEDSWVTKLLGRLRLTGLYEESTYYNESKYSRDQLDSYEVAAALNGGVFGPGLNTVSTRAGVLYAMPVNNDSYDFLNLTSLSDLSGVKIGGVPFGTLRNRVPSYFTYTGWDTISQSFVDFSAKGYNLSDNDGFPASFSTSHSMVDVESQVLVGQSYLWDDTIVLTGTWRNDVQSSNARGAPSWSEINSRVDNPYAESYYNVPLRPLDEDADEDTTSWSIVVHTPDFLKQFLPAGWDFSVYKSMADNFQPSGSRVNIFNEQIDPVTGSTEEMGFMVSGLDGRLSARFNWYETGVLNNSYDTGGISTTEGILLGLMRQLDNPTNIANGYTATDVQNYLPPQGVQDLNGFAPNWNDPENSTTNRNSYDNGTRDFTAKGMEVELSYNPIPEWTILVTAGRQETVTSNSYPKMQEYVDTFVNPQWINSDFAQNYIVNDAGETLSHVAYNTIVEPVIRATLQDGIPSVEQREWRFGLNTSYQLGRAEDGFMKWFGDLTVGGGLRWEDEIGIGFAVDLNELGDYALDPSQPFYGPSMTYLDVFARSSYNLGDGRELVVQVNIKDLTDHDELIPFYAAPDGNKLYRMLEGRLISASATLKF